MARRSEFLKGSLELAVLGLLARRGELYGYRLVQELKIQGPGVSVGEGTIYPLLTRLENAGLVKSRWGSKDGRRTHFYSLTRKGRAELGIRRSIWESITSTVKRAVYRTA